MGDSLQVEIPESAVACKGPSRFLTHLENLVSFLPKPPFIHFDSRIVKMQFGFSHVSAMGNMFATVTRSESK